VHQRHRTVLYSIGRLWMWSWVVVDLGVMDDDVRLLYGAVFLRGTTLSCRV
jgi:hypothetical protein